MFIIWKRLKNNLWITIGSIYLAIMVTMNLINITIIMICINLHSCFMYDVHNVIACLSFSLFLIDNWQLFYKILCYLLIYLYHTCEIVKMIKNIKKLILPPSNMLHILCVKNNIILPLLIFYDADLKF